MKKSLGKDTLVISFLLLLTIFIFHKLIINKLIPIPVNFMAFWYEPFKSQVWLDYPAGIPHRAVGADIFRILYPLKDLAINLLLSGKWPLWNPYIFSGTPLLANFQTSIFYPFNFFYFFLPFLDAWTVIIFIQPFLAGLFMYLFLRAIKVSRLGSVFSASSFTLMPFLIVWLEHGIFNHTLVWLPLILYAIEKFLERTSWWSLGLITLGFSFAILGGHPHPLFFVILVAISYFLFKLTDRVNLRLEKIFWFFIAGAFSLLLTAVQLLPTAEIFRFAAIDSASSEFIFKKFLLSPTHLITFFIPDFFGNIASYNFWGFFDYTETIGYFGIIPLIFCLCAVFGKRDKRILYFTLLTILSLSFAFPLPTTKFLISLNLPVISTNVPSRILFITGFSSIILAAFGIDGWRKSKNSSTILKLLLKIITPLALIYVGAIVFTILAPRWFSCPDIRTDCWQVALRNSILPSIVFFIGTILIIVGNFVKKKRDYFVLVLIFLNILGGFYFSEKFLAFSDRMFVYPKVPVIRYLQENAGINRFFGFGEARIIPDIAVQYRLFSTDGYDPLYIKRYGQFLEAANTDGKIKTTVTRSDAYLDSGSESDFLSNNPRRKKVLDLLGVKYILVKNDSVLDKSRAWQQFPQSDYPLIWEDRSWKIYQNSGVLPRVFLAGNAIVEKEDQAILDKIFDPALNLRENVILEEPLHENFILGDDREGKVEVLNYQPNKIDLETNSSENKILLVSDVFYPGWQVYLDGMEGKIYRSDFVFRAVAIPAGKHKVSFLYNPKSFNLGLRVSMFATMLFIIWLGILKLKEKKVVGKQK